MRIAKVDLNMKLLGQPAPKTGKSGAKRLRERLGLARSFGLVVLLPTAAACFYYAFMETESFVAESKIVVRKSTYNEGGGSSDTFLSKLGIGTAAGSTQDAMIVVDYVKGRSVIGDIGGVERLRKMYGTEEIDWLSRLDSAEPFEDIWAYWKDHVTVNFDTLSGIISLRVRAYDRDRAQQLNKDIIAASEKLLNTISKRSRQDALSRTIEEVNEAAQKLAVSRTEMLSLQQKIQSVDPIETAKTITGIISALSRERLEYEARSSRDEFLGVARKPGQLDLASRISSVDKQIKKYQDLLVGKENPDSITQQLRDFEILALKTEFDEKIYSLARGAYEEARRQLDRQELYLGTVVSPLRPDEATYPDIIPQTLIVFVTAVVLWAIASLVTASVRDSIA